jgi:hypothetical protein
MALKETVITGGYGGISIAKKVGQQGSFQFGTHLNITDDPNEIKLNLTGTKKSASVVTDLVKWIVDGTPFDTNRYAYGDSGNVYKIDASDTFTLLRTVSNSHGQGMEVQNDYLYYTQDSQIGRYGPLSGSPSFTDNWQTGLDNTATVLFAPITVLNDRLIVGHGNNVATWDGAIWTLAALTLPAQLNVRALSRTDQYILIGAWRGSAVTASEDGYVYIWDALSEVSNDSYPTEGGLNAINYYRNTLFSIQGKNGFIYTETSPFNKKHQIPKLEIRKFVEVYPGAITTWQNMTFFGISNSDSATVTRGVYSWGSKQSAVFADALNYALTISTGNNGSTVQIGAVKGIGNDLYIAWKDGSSYGVDKVDETSSYATSGTYESLIEDDGSAGREKAGTTVTVTHLPLASGESITINYKHNRQSTFQTGITNNTVGAITTRLDNASLPGQEGSRFTEFEWQTVLAGTGSSTPVVTDQTFLFNDLKKERKDQ